MFFLVFRTFFLILFFVFFWTLFFVDGEVLGKDFLFQNLSLNSTLKYCIDVHNSPLQFLGSHDIWLKNDLFCTAITALRYCIDVYFPPAKSGDVNPNPNRDNPFVKNPANPVYQALQWRLMDDGKTDYNRSLLQFLQMWGEQVKNVIDREQGKNDFDPDVKAFGDMLWIVRVFLGRK